MLQGVLVQTTQLVNYTDTYSSLRFFSKFCPPILNAPGLGAQTTSYLYNCCASFERSTLKYQPKRGTFQNYTVSLTLFLRAMKGDESLIRPNSPGASPNVWRHIAHTTNCTRVAVEMARRNSIECCGLMLGVTRGSVDIVGLHCRGRRVSGNTRGLVAEVLWLH